ncbi:DUF3137 domain-containing protein [Pedobacter foliorum]|uniref:DUF3137 domain-containing protein n=1 Tax=Pedobacter foliorum TaxID=2739058 RepID=UPI001563B593|nr:DUF3137 domain-containing protein [Pedobacter foliorum]NRF38613.1 DUF3137 domain-containing protein [Pedobacter foliorum]
MAEETAALPSLQTVLNELEVQRKELSNLKIKAYLFLASGITLIAIGAMLGSLVIAGAICGGILIIFSIVFFSKAGQKFSDYRDQFKQRVVSSALKSIDQSLKIEYKYGLPENDFINSQLFTQRPDRYTSEDQIYGNAGKTQFAFSEVHAEYKTETQTKNGRQEHWHTILKGIVFWADFNKNFNGLTVVKPKDMGNALGAWISDKMPIFSSSSKQLVKLESPEFNKAFVTYSTDQVEARYILTPAMMERLCELNDKSGATISVSFIGSYVYIAFPLEKDYFEPPVFKSLLTTKSLDEDLSIIRFMYSIIAELDLNTRIWGKE